MPRKMRMPGLLLWGLFILVACVPRLAPGRPNAAPTRAAPILQPSPTPTPEPWRVPGRRYYFPVQPPEIARYSDRHHDYPATDIFVPIGSMVVAVTDGVVNEVCRVDSWDPRVDDGATRPGLFVAIVGDDGVRYHTSHLSAVEPSLAPGVRVHAGRLVGRSGQSGNACLTPPHVHFGISRPLGPGDWQVRRGQVWPYAYLQAWRAGEDRTPILPLYPWLREPIGLGDAAGGDLAEPCLGCGTCQRSLLVLASGVQPQAVLD